MRRMVPFVMLVAVVLTACGNGGGDTSASPGPTVTVTQTVTEPASPAASPAATTSPDQAANACDELGSEGEQLAFLFVTEPTVGAEVHPGFSVSGCSNAFEASYQWELLDRDGNVLAQDTGTASCGTGCVGDLSFTVDYQVDELQVGTLRVFTASPKDGSDTDVNAIPLRLQPS